MDLTNRCGLCEYKSKDKYNLKVHIQSVHEKAKLFKCDICGKTLVSNQSLKNHMLQVHEMGQVKSEHKV